MEAENEQLIIGSAVDVTADVKNIQSITKFADKKNSILHMLGHDLRGPLKLVKKCVNIVKLITDYLEECKRSENLAGIQFKLTSTADKMLIRLDNAKFMQVINNLISNSLKFTPAGGTISIHIEDSAEQVNFVISDTGIGILANLLRKH